MAKPIMRLAAVVLAAGLLDQQAGAYIEMSGPPWSIPNSSFVSMGGEQAPTNGAVTMEGSLGITGVNKLESADGEFKMGTGVLGSGQVAVPNLDRAHPFPVPYMPSRGHVQITFSNLTAKCTIRVYSLSGELVREITKDSSSTDRADWTPVNNQAGQPLASGVYLYTIVSSEGQVKTGKLMVIK